MTADNLQVERFEFLLQRDGHGSEWLRVQGSGGCIGDAALHSLRDADDDHIARTTTSMLGDALRYERRDDLRVLVDGKLKHVRARVIAAQAVARNGTVRCVVWGDHG